jgi:hypothetical protein
MRSAFLKVFTSSAKDAKDFNVENPSDNADAQLYLPGITNYDDSVYVTSDNVANYKIIVDGNNPTHSAVLVTKLKFLDLSSEQTLISNVRMYLTGTVASGAFVAVKTAADLTGLDPVAALSDFTHYFTDDTTATSDASLFSGKTRIIDTDDATYVQIPVNGAFDQPFETDYILFQLQINQGTEKITTTNVLQGVTITFLYDEEENV